MTFIGGQPAELAPSFTLVFDAIAADAAPPLAVASTNGTAG